MFWKVTQLQVLVEFVCSDGAVEFRRFMNLIRPVILRLRISSQRCTVLASNRYTTDLDGRISWEWEQEVKVEI